MAALLPLTLTAASIICLGLVFQLNRRLRSIARPAATAFVFFGMLAIISAMTAAPFLTEAPPSIPRLAAILLLAWLGGFVMIGSPGGIGVREGLIIFLLSGCCGREAAALSALSVRIVTTLGDVLFALSIITGYGWRAAIKKTDR